MKSSGWPSSRTNDRCATVGASMRRPVSLRGKRLMADKKSDVVLPEWTPQDAYNSDLPSPPRPRSEEHTSELQSLMRISYAVFCLKKKKNHIYTRAADAKACY